MRIGDENRRDLLSNVLLCKLSRGSPHHCPCDAPDDNNVLVMIITGCRFVRTACRQVLPVVRHLSRRSPPSHVNWIAESPFNVNRCKELRQIRCCHSGQDKTPDGESDELSFDEELKQLSVFQRYKKLAKEYWYVLIPVHCGTSIFWFGSCILVVYT
jgi:hypothetical protein